MGDYYIPRSVAIQGDLVALIGLWFGGEEMYSGVTVFKRRDTMGFVEWLPYINLNMTDEDSSPSNVIMDGNMVYVSYVVDGHEDRPGFVNVYDLNQVHSLV